MARRDLVHCPVSGVGSLNGSLLSCLRKDVALVSYCDRGLEVQVGDGSRLHSALEIVKNAKAGTGDGSYLHPLGRLHRVS